MKTKAEIILSDYNDCGKKKCGECAAHEVIEGTNTSFCKLLCMYRSRLQDAINATIENN